MDKEFFLFNHITGTLVIRGVSFHKNTANTKSNNTLKTGVPFLNFSEKC